MIDKEEAKRKLLAMAKRVPIYKVLTNPQHRDYFAVQYLNHKDPKMIPGYLSSTGRMPNFRYSTVLMALDALDNEGDLARIKTAATKVAGESPERLKPYLMLSDIAWREGDYGTALAQARTAWMLHPGSLNAALRTVRLGYIVGEASQADYEAIVALQRFPRNSGLLWIACKYCRSREQLEKIRGTVRRPSDKPKMISGLARPLAAAALRAGCLDTALQIYVEACLIELGGGGLAVPVGTKKLAGKSGSRVLQDLRRVFESEGIPFFFAAGTALGLVRNGRPLDHDSDIDVGIFDDDWDKERLINIFSEHPDFDLDDANPESPKVGVVHRNGASIDLFRFYREGDGIYHDAIFVRWKNTPFPIERVTLKSGDIVFLPGNIDRYLTENYGDWRVPNKTFDAFVDAPNVEVTWPEYMVVHKVRRAYRSIRGGDLVAARRELEGLQAALQGVEGGPELIREMLL